MDKQKEIEEFLKTLGEVSKEGFTIICNKCESTNIKPYDSTGCGSEMTGCWGDAGLKCEDCGNAMEVMSND